VQKIDFIKKVLHYEKCTMGSGCGTSITNVQNRGLIYGNVFYKNDVRNGHRFFI